MATLETRLGNLQRNVAKRKTAVDLARMLDACIAAWSVEGHPNGGGGLSDRQPPADLECTRRDHAEGCPLAHGWLRDAVAYRVRVWSTAMPDLPDLDPGRPPGPPPRCLGRWWVSWGPDRDEYEFGPQRAADWDSW